MDEAELIEGLVRRIRTWFPDRSRRDLPVRRAVSPESLAEELDLPLRAHGLEAEDLLRLVDSYLESSVRTSHPNFMQPLWGGLSAAGLGAEIVAALANTSSYNYELAPAATVVENQLIETLGEMIGWPDAEGTFTSGGSQANLLALLLARDRARPRAASTGFDGRALAIHTSSEAHYSVLTAAHVLGLGHTGLFFVPTDEHGQMQPAALEASLERAREQHRASFCVVATSGTTVRAAFDPLPGLTEVCRRHGLWLHVDAALGGVALFSDQTSHLLQGLEDADSVTWDAHKLLGVPLTCSTLLTPHRGALPRSCAATGSADYLFYPSHAQYDLGRKSLQCARRVDALKLWLCWKAEGHSGWRRRIERFLELAAHLEARVVEHPELELMSSRVFTNVCFRWRGGLEDDETLDKVNESIRKQLLDGGEFMVSQARIDGRVVLRPAMANPSIDRQSLDGLVAAVAGLGAELAR